MRSPQRAPDWLSPEAMWLRWQDKEGQDAVLLPGGTRAGALETAANYQTGVAGRAACHPQQRNKPLPVSPLPCFGERLAEAGRGSPAHLLQQPVRSILSEFFGALPHPP